MIGDLNGTPDEVLASARAILASISPLGRLSLSADRSELIFETDWAKGVHVERLPARDGLPRELVRHAAVMSLKSSLYETAGSA